MLSFYGSTEFKRSLFTDRLLFEFQKKISFERIVSLLGKCCTMLKIVDVPYSMFYSLICTDQGASTSQDDDGDTAVVASLDDLDSDR